MSGEWNNMKPARYVSKFLVWVSCLEGTLLLRTRGLEGLTSLSVSIPNDDAMDVLPKITA